MPQPLDPKLARAIDEILRTAPPSYVEHRRSKLEDDKWAEWRRRYPKNVARLFDPQEIREQIAWRREVQDPYSEANLKLERFVEALEAGGRISVTNLQTGAVTDVAETKGSRSGAAPRN